MTLETWSGQFHVLQNEPRQFGPYAAAFHGAGGASASPELYIVIEPLNPLLGPALGDLLPRLGAVFERESLSLTGALIRCIGLAHDVIRAWNLKAIPAHRSGLAIAALALRGEQAYLAQAGPAVTYLLRGDQLRRIVGPQEAATPVGLADRAQPDFNYFALRSHDTFLLAFHSVERYLAQEQVAQLLGERPDRALESVYDAVGADEDFAALLVAFDPPEGTPIDLPPFPPRVAPPPAAPSRAASAGQRPPPPRRSVDNRQASLFDESGQGDDDNVVAAGAPAPASTVGEAIPSSAAPAAAPEDAPALPPFPDVLRPRPGSPQVRPVPARPHDHAAAEAPPAAAPDDEGAVRVLASEEADGGLLEPEEAAERLRRVRQRPRHRTEPGGEFGDVDPTSGRPYDEAGEPVDLGEKVGLGRAAGPALRRRVEIRVSRRLLIWGGAALVAGAAVAGAAVAIPRVLSDNREERARQLVAGAQKRFDDARELTDASAKREGYRQAQAKLEEALTLVPDDPEARDLAASVREEMALLNREVELSGLEQVTGLATILSAPGAARRLEVAGGSVFLLDGVGDEVIYFQLTDPGGAEIVFRAGVDIEGAPTGAPVEIAYLTSPRASVLLIADDAGADYVYVPGKDPTVVVVPGRASWKGIDALVWNSDRLFAIDLAAGTTHALRFDGANFAVEDDLPLGGVTPDGLRSATWNGRRLFLLDKRGAIYMLDDAGLVAVEPAGLDRPLAAPQAISADIESGQLYLADRGNNRIVVLEPDGSFVQQLVAPDLVSLSLLSVDAVNQQIYLIAGDALYTAALPPIRS